MLRAYYSKNTGNLMWEDPAANTRGKILQKSLIKSPIMNGQGKVISVQFYYKFASGRVEPINMWRVFEAPRRKKKPTPTNSTLRFNKVSPVAKKANSTLSRAFRNGNNTNTLKSIMAVINSPNLMNDLTINNLIKILSQYKEQIPANKANYLRTVLVNKLENNGSANNIQNAIYEINFTNSQNARLANAFQIRLMLTSG